MGERQCGVGRKAIDAHRSTKTLAHAAEVSDQNAPPQGRGITLEDRRDRQMMSSGVVFTAYGGSAVEHIRAELEKMPSVAQYERTIL